MVNENHEEFFNHQRKSTYLDNTRNNAKHATTDPEYNNKNNTDISVGATGRIIK